ncbi:nicotinate phosphoribosyltransferase [Smaragdicoccus niigatensis]|uniref:nicotinate phosphoribosyltransferase n=1 Tax=Smaragdicoccus niigatensis TaxID=359359 RepID=UPI000362C53C|nr:nicotinate phosphoribosyltransferase [Smaragdicoccus niigatensis]
MGHSTALLTDQYELTMLAAALRDGTADRPVVFEVFARRLPEGRRYGVACGAQRLLDAVDAFRFGADEIETVGKFLDDRTIDWLRRFRFSGDIDGYPEGELFFPDSPILTVRGTFGECVLLETLLLSVLNHDCAIAAAAARMVTAARGRTLIEMGGRRTHEQAAPSAARAAYIAGFTATSNLEAVRRYGIPGAGTSAHAFVLLHSGLAADPETAAFASQVSSMGPQTTLLVDTFDVRSGVEKAIAAAGTKLGAVRIDSGDLGQHARDVREQLDDAGATSTRILLSGDLDEFSIEALREAPVDGFGVGTSLVTGSGAPTAGLVYKLVEVDGIPVAKKSSQKATHGGAKRAFRRFDDGVAVEEVIRPTNAPLQQTLRELQTPMMRSGERTYTEPLVAARARLATGLQNLPPQALDPSAGEPAIPTSMEA